MNNTRQETRPTTSIVEGVVVPVDNRTSKERVEDTCFEGLIRDYTEKRDFTMVEAVGALYERILRDRHAADEIQTPVQTDTPEDTL